MVEEKLNIQITEEPDKQKENIIDLHYEIQLIDTNQTQIITEHITGHLESLYLETTQAQIIIQSAMHPNIIYYENVDFHDSQLLPLRIRAIDKFGEGFNYSHEKIVLNEQLIITIKAMTGTTIKCMIRYCK